MRFSTGSMAKRRFLLISLGGILQTAPVFSNVLIIAYIDALVGSFLVINLFLNASNPDQLLQFIIGFYHKNTFFYTKHYFQITLNINNILISLYTCIK